MAFFFAIELTQGPNLRFPNLHVTQAIKRPQLGALGGRGPNRAPCEGAVTCRGKVVAKCYGCEREGLCAAHKDGLCVPRHEGEEHERGGEFVEDPNWVSIGQRAQCLLPVGTTAGHFLLSGWGVGREVVAPLTNEEEVGGGRRPPRSPWLRCALGRQCRGPPWKGMLGLRCRQAPLWW